MAFFIEYNQTLFLLSLKIKHLTMKTYKVLTSFYKLSDKKNYSPNDTIELEKEQALEMIKNGQVEAIEETYSNSDSEEGTKLAAIRKTPEQADKEIKKLNKSL